MGFGGEPPYPLLTLSLDLDLDLDAQIAGEIVEEIAEEVAPLGPAGEATRPAKRPRTPTKVPSTKDALPSSERQRLETRSDPLRPFAAISNRTHAAQELQWSGVGSFYHAVFPPWRHASLPHVP